MLQIIWDALDIKRVCFLTGLFLFNSSSRSISRCSSFCSLCCARLCINFIRNCAFNVLVSVSCVFNFSTLMYHKCAPNGFMYYIKILCHKMFCQEEILQTEQYSNTRSTNCFIIHSVWPFQKGDKGLKKWDKFVSHQKVCVLKYL